ncbi:Glycosyltransferase involved in cell wall bisynthesis [Nocardioides alpinus]|uniref:Glycosyltransferase family 4 protein n=1 Tax=Nocardioides alpinus TaxID=748909 RepID=A0A1I0W3S2_9ACTN|nr:glycosyltransferase [Nocardioides alpinus]PKH37670.1 glycosyltransferase family 4 protein [Nocardioides alpinus]SFA83379.1 Glycosyltransferase involved in cell wall bisynthesis [Nocardioides alpinus]
MSRAAVAIAHDYLTQRGGAERVVLTLMKAFPQAAVHTTLFDPDATYPEFAAADVRTSPINRFATLRRDHRLALPVLATAASRMRIDADVVVASSSGWAHGFETPGRTVVYCHNPARWLYQTDEYLGGSAWRSPLGPPMLALRPFLKRWDRRQAEQVDVYLANSRVVQRRIAATYGRDAELLPPPHGMDASAAREAVPEIACWEPGYALVVSRLLPYKNVDAVIEAVRGTGRRLVVVGRGPEEARLRATLPDNVRLLGGLSDAQLRTVYAGAGVLVAASHEDFGLAPLEAAAFGVPAVALRGGGFLETVLEGETGLFFDAPTPDHITAALDISDRQTWDGDRLRARAEEFGETRFIERIRAIVRDAGRST